MAEGPTRTSGGKSALAKRKAESAKGKPSPGKGGVESENKAVESAEIERGEITDRSRLSKKTDSCRKEKHGKRRNTGKRRRRGRKSSRISTLKIGEAEVGHNQ